MYRVLADVIVVVHLAYVSFIIVGLLLVLLGRLFRWRWVANRWFRLTHLAMMGIVVVENLLGITCPLTTWENSLRQAAGETVQKGTFMGRLAHDLIFCTCTPAQFTAIYVLFFLLVVLSFVAVPIRWRRA